MGFAIGGRLEAVEEYMKYPHQPECDLEEAIKLAKANAGQARKRLRRATWVTNGALVMTVGAFVLAGVWAEKRDDNVGSLVHLTDGAADATEKRCGWSDTDAQRVYAKIRPVDLSRRETTVLTAPRFTFGASQSSPSRRSRPSQS